MSVSLGGGAGGCGRQEPDGTDQRLPGRSCRGAAGPGTAEVADIVATYFSSGMAGPETASSGPAVLPAHRQARGVPSCPFRRPSEVSKPQDCGCWVTHRPRCWSTQASVRVRRPGRGQPRDGSRPRCRGRESRSGWRRAPDRAGWSGRCLDRSVWSSWSCPYPAGHESIRRTDTQGHPGGDPRSRARRAADGHEHLLLPVDVLRLPADPNVPRGGVLGP